MKQWGLTLIVVAVAILLGSLVAVYLSNKSSDVKIFSGVKNAKTTKTPERFHWGVQGGSFMLNQPQDTYHIENVDLQVAKTKELGANLIRANLETSIARSPQPFKINYIEASNDDFIERVTSSGLDLLLVLDPDIPKTIGEVDYLQEGYTFGTYVAERYRGKVKYYQMANEVTGTIVKPQNYTGPTFKGENGIEYSKARYDATLGWIKGMAKGIREKDPSAKLVVSGHWILYDVVGKLIQDGADFDILGWAWYSSDGTDITSREYNYGQRLNLAQKLSSFNKDLWIVEFNKDGGSYSQNGNGEPEQAEFFAKMLENIYSSKYFKGFIVYTLFDDRAAPKPEDANFGLVKVDYKEGKNVVRANKKAFDVYRDFISGHKELPTSSLPN